MQWKESPTPAHSRERVLERRAQLAVAEIEAVELARDRPLAVEDEVGLLAEQQPERKARRRHERRPVEHLTEDARGLPLAQLLGGDRIEWALERLVVDREPVQAHGVVEMDPREPLPPAPGRAAEAEA